MKPPLQTRPSAILLVKTSSMGDVVHLLPAVSDIARSLPQATVDWVVEEQFADLPALHPAVARVIPVALRRWRTTPLSRATRAEFAAFCGRLRERRYDIVIDAQGLVKSAALAALAHGISTGPGFGYARERMAALFYGRRLAVPWTLPAIVANRRLIGEALGFPDTDPMSTSPPDYGIRASADQADWLPPAPYVALLHGASAAEKLWPEENWRALGEFLARRGVNCILPWGSDDERRRALRLAPAIARAVVAPALGLAQAAGLLAGAKLAIGVDSGLAHLAAAVGTPAITLFCGSNPDRTGVVAMAGRVAHNLGARGHAPSTGQVIAAVAKVMP